MVLRLWDLGMAKYLAENANENGCSDIEAGVAICLSEYLFDIFRNLSYYIHEKMLYSKHAGDVHFAGVSLMSFRLAACQLIGCICTSSVISCLRLHRRLPLAGYVCLS